MDTWLPSIDDEHCVKQELRNKEDPNIVAVVVLIIKKVKI